MNTYDPAAFQQFERAGWNQVAEVYAALTAAMGITTDVAGSAILDAAHVHADVDVVDLATGPG